MNPPEKLETLKAYINTKGHATATVHGKSMFPTIQDGWKIKIKQVSAKEIICGDIIAFRRDKLICHRLFGKFKWNKKIYFIHKGDSENTEGGLFEEGVLVGKITEVFDEEGNKINKKKWQRSSDYLVRVRLAGYIYLLLSLVKRSFFNKRRYGLIRKMAKLFWRFSERFILF